MAHIDPMLAQGGSFLGLVLGLAIFAFQTGERVTGNIYSKKWEAFGAVLTVVGGVTLVISSLLVLNQAG